MLSIHRSTHQPLKKGDVKVVCAGFFRVDERAKLLRVAADGDVSAAAAGVVGGDDSLQDENGGISDEEGRGRGETKTDQSSANVNLRSLGRFVDKEVGEVRSSESKLSGNRVGRMNRSLDEDLECREVVVRDTSVEEKRGIEEGAADDALLEEFPAREGRHQ